MGKTYAFSFRGVYSSERGIEETYPFTCEFMPKSKPFARILAPFSTASTVQLTTLSVKPFHPQQSFYPFGKVFSFSAEHFRFATKLFRVVIGKIVKFPFFYLYCTCIKVCTVLFVPENPLCLYILRKMIWQFCRSMKIQ